jgi:hypothetical protein
MARDTEDSLCAKMDGKIYYVDGETGNEYCVSDECKLYYQLVKLCRSFFRKNGAKKGENNTESKQRTSKNPVS